jgi:hypothetical protein
MIPVSGMATARPARSAARAGLVAALCLALGMARMTPRAPRRPLAPAEQASVSDGRYVWLAQAYRRFIVASVAASIPSSATTFIDGRLSYFVAYGDGLFEARSTDQPLLAGERVVVEGVFLVKSELLR